MNSVNFWLIFGALGELEAAEFQLGRALDIDPNGEESTKRVFRRYIVPTVDEWSKWRREKHRLSLAYYLNRPDVLDFILASLQDLTIGEPSDLHKFYFWLWEVLYPGQYPENVDLSDVVENNDLLEINLQPQDLE